MRNQRHLLWLTLLLAPACASGAATGANLTRSPSLDYPPPPAETSDGQVVGVDGVPPETKLATSPTLGNGGLSAAATPASIEEARPAPAAIPDDPQCAVLGMRDKMRKLRCHPAPVLPPNR